MRTLQETKTFGFVIANAKFMLLDEEHMVEVLRERKRVFQEKNEERDFWIVPEPKFLDAMPDVSAKVCPEKKKMGFGCTISERACVI